MGCIYNVWRRAKREPQKVSGRVPAPARRLIQGRLIMSTIEQKIQNRALALGYEKCGIIPIREMDAYAEQLEERIRKVPQAKGFYERMRRLTALEKEFPWAKSVVVVVTNLGKYKIPEHLKDNIGKSYLFDPRIDSGSAEFQNSLALEKYLQELGLKTASNRKFGLVGLRLAAMKAGLGMVRNNNFFYTESGSWVSLEAWVTDREMELIETTSLPACPTGCNRCVAACPSGSLSAPYTMSPNSCISFLTTFGGRDLPNEPLCKTFGNWIYGCDACQNECQMNRDKWQETAEFPGLSALAPYLTPENIMDMDDDFYKKNVQPKFFYLTEDELWKWKVNVLCFMRNNYKGRYQPYIAAACENGNEKIRDMATLIYRELFEEDN
jgi:epoxyqueuosine reductase